MFLFFYYICMFTSKNLYKIIIALVVLFIVFLVLRDNNYFGAFSDNNKEYKTQIAVRKNNNVEACKNEVLKQLKSPWSAKFWGNWNYEGNIYSDTFKTENYVDSQNGFWALLRTNFICSVVGWEVFMMLDSDESNLHDQYENRAWR